MAYKYIIFGNGYEWCEISLQKIINRNDTVFTNELPVKGNITKFFSMFILSDRLKNFIPKFFKTLIYNEIINELGLKKIDVNSQIVFIIFDGNRLGNQNVFFDFIKDHYKFSKFIYVFTNIVKITEASGRGYIDKLNDWYDVVFAFDPEDAKKYGFSYSPLIYDADPNYKREEKESKEDLVFYVGQAKDRLPGLLSCFEKLKQLGIKTDFHIANVKEEDIKYSDKITYNKFMTYAECVESIQKATCLIDVIQGESTGLTIKTCEAVCYDKKLITTNKHVVEYPFYDPRYIRVVESPDDIDESFFTENKNVHYSEEGKAYFSADSFLERLHNELENRES